MLSDNEIEILYFRITSWHAAQYKQHKAALPKEEWILVRKELNRFHRQASQYYRTKDERIAELWRNTTYYVLPWKVLLWYSFNKTNKLEME